MHFNSCRRGTSRYVGPAMALDPNELGVAAAQLQNCCLLLTEDLQDRAVYGGVAVRNPFALGVSEDLSAYAVERAPVLAHPRRGRPKRARPAA